MWLFKYIRHERPAPGIVMRPDQPRETASLGTACLNPSRAGAVLNIARRVVKSIRKIDPDSVHASIHIVVHNPMRGRGRRHGRATPM